MAAILAVVCRPGGRHFIHVADAYTKVSWIVVQAGSGSLCAQNNSGLSDANNFLDLAIKKTFQWAALVGCHGLCRRLTRLASILTSPSSPPSDQGRTELLDEDDFQDRVLKSQKPVVIDFHAQWCGPCKILGPRLEKVVSKHEGKILMAKVDIDDHTDLALEYEVSAVPTVLAMKNGDVVDKFVGIKDEDQLEAFLKKLIGP
ncbi:thioredoxin mitochondrial [Crotalus adamanteus]|uniref:Thioredoxin, mitochondrial n=1 Tax=Crotalus adamanteus TaxID=8729 RepID=A0AAW1BDV4_CROAD